MDELPSAGPVRDEPVDDAELVRRTLAGDGGAFDALVRRYMRPALAVAWEFTTTLEDAEDIVQDAFLRTLRALASYDSRRPFPAWFFTIVRNVSRNAAAARNVRDVRHADIDAADDRVGARAATCEGAADAAERAELLGHLERAMDDLPSMQRACFRLCEAEGFSSAEVAAMLGISESTVRVHTHRARRTLRSALRFLTDDVRTE